MQILPLSPSASLESPRSSRARWHPAPIFVFPQTLGAPSRWGGLDEKIFRALCLLAVKPKAEPVANSIR